jgi:hypothetical protein
VTIVLMSAVTPSETSTETMCVPVVLIGSSSRTRRLSRRTPRACRIASTISCEVTEPNSRPSSPAWCEIVRTVFRRSAAVSSAFAAASAAARSADSRRRSASAIEAGVAGCASFRGTRKLRR